MNYDVKRQILNNYNYFFMKLIIRTFQILLVLSLILIVCSIINNTFLYVLGMFYTLYSLYNIYQTFNKYYYIINDIRETMDIKDLSFEINLNTISNNLFKGLFNYGK